jgi:hypothetical protein
MSRCHKEVTAENQANEENAREKERQEVLQL